MPLVYTYTNSFHAIFIKFLLPVLMFRALTIYSVYTSRAVNSLVKQLCQPPVGHSGSQSLRCPLTAIYKKNHNTLTRLPWRHFVRMPLIATLPLSRHRSRGHTGRAAGETARHRKRDKSGTLHHPAPLSAGDWLSWRGYGFTQPLYNKHLRIATRPPPPYFTYRQ